MENIKFCQPTGTLDMNIKYNIIYIDIPKINKSNYIFTIDINNI